LPASRALAHHVRSMRWPVGRNVCSPAPSSSTGHVAGADRSLTPPCSLAGAMYALASFATLADRSHVRLSALPRSPAMSARRSRICLPVLPHLRAGCHARSLGHVFSPEPHSLARAAAFACQMPRSLARVLTPVFLCLLVSCFWTERTD
jgi:hypothetical protein